jgi:fermentation-respiration switch protein FrsA (DUF1100 family)
MKAKRMIRIVAILLAFYILILVFQDKIIFFPHPWPESFVLPEKLDNCRLQAVELTTSDGVKLDAVYAESFSTTEDERKVVLFSHGNAGNLIGRLDKADKICKIGFDVFIYDYRGFGRSQGSPNVKGAIIDGITALNYLTDTKKIKKENIVIYGESLGTGIAAELIKGNESAFAGLVLESGFASLSAQASRKFPGIGKLILKRDLPTIDIIKNYSGKLLIIHSKADKIIPYTDSEKVLAACPSESKTILTFEGARHNDPVWYKPEYIQAWQNFRKSL